MVTFHGFHKKHGLTHTNIFLNLRFLSLLIVYPTYITGTNLGIQELVLREYAVVYII